MSALVEIWESELARLREKVAVQTFLRSKPESEQERRESAGAGAGAGPKESSPAKKEERRRREAPAESTMSEATVFLLMDRFVPW
ncbi:hypothetical protein BT93_L3808 [Corymbia citriodora subsp. variegata]|uniref:Uncharacterized protein n=1 Tax=Corymbia citriodora subsp. variegata TaxID=360336 RepID=A0A8T0CGN4_CORYI|nr:hypothetical protein BT93_L3808 [Corymbia citriodora subsp. variegata]